jgi:hypothetical protein
MIVANQTNKPKMRDSFMMEEFATDEVLHSTLTRLRGRYGVLAVMENTKPIPDAGKIEQYEIRTTEISLLMDALIKAPLEVKNRAIKLYSQELRTLNEKKSPIPVG